MAPETKLPCTPEEVNLKLIEMAADITALQTVVRALRTQLAEQLQFAKQVDIERAHVLNGGWISSGNVVAFTARYESSLSWLMIDK